MRQSTDEHQTEANTMTIMENTELPTTTPKGTIIVKISPQYAGSLFRQLADHAIRQCILAFKLPKIL